MRFERVMYELHHTMMAPEWTSDPLLPVYSPGILQTLKPGSHTYCLGDILGCCISGVRLSEGLPMAATKRQQRLKPRQLKDLLKTDETARKCQISPVL